MQFYENMAYRAPSSMDLMGMTKQQLKEAALKGDDAAATELARRMENSKEKDTYGRYLTEEETKAMGSRSASGAAAGFKVAPSEQHRAMTAQALREAADRGDGAARAELERRAHNRSLKRAK